MGLEIPRAVIFPFLPGFPAALGARKGSGAAAGFRLPPQHHGRLYSFQKEASGRPSERSCLDPSWELPAFSTLLSPGTFPATYSHPGEVQGSELIGTESKKQVEDSGI